MVLAWALAGGVGWVAFLFTDSALKPDLGRVTPASGLGRLSSRRSLARLLGGFLKVAIVGVVVGWTIWAERHSLVELSGRSFEQIPGITVDLMQSLSLRAAVALFVLALFDYGFQKWQFELDLRMTKHEIREELRRF